MVKFSRKVKHQISRLLGIEKYFEISVAELSHENAKFVLIEWNNQGFWLPKAEITIKQINDKYHLRVPERLMAHMKDIVKSTS